MDSNHRCLGVGQKSSPLDHGINRKWTHRESHPNPRFAGPMSSCWTMSPSCFSSPSGSRGTRTHKRDAPAACFQPDLATAVRLHPRYRSAANLASGRMTSVVKLRELESNQRLRGQSPASLPAATIPQEGQVLRVKCQVPEKRFASSSFWHLTLDSSLFALDSFAGAGIEPADSWFKATNFYQQKLPRIMERDGWDSNPRAGA